MDEDEGNRHTIDCRLEVIQGHTFGKQSIQNVRDYVGSKA